MTIGLQRPLAAFALAAAFSAAAANHDLTVTPVTGGRFTIACSHIAQDAGAIAAANTSVENFWEGKEDRYIGQILSNPTSTVRFGVAVPDDRGLYPQLASQSIDHVAIVCYPTDRGNADPGYVLPQTGAVVPHMQPAGVPPRLIGHYDYAFGFGYDLSPPPFGSPRLPLVVFSHGLGGSPLSGSHIDALVQLASHGYIVAAVFHGDGRFSRLKLEDLSDYWYILTKFDRFVEMELMRTLSLKALVDAMLAHPHFGPGIDPDRIGAFGASLGAQAVTNLIGARLTTSLAKTCRETPRDPRIKAAVGLVPFAGLTLLPSFCDDQAGADSVNRPMLSLAGTADATAPIGLVRQAVNRFASSRFLVEMDIPHQYLSEYRGDVFTWTSTFLNAYLAVAYDSNAMDRFIKMRSVSGGPADALTIDRHSPFPPTGDEAIAVEFFHSAMGTYFLTARPEDIALLDTNPQSGWRRTGHSFKVYSRIPSDTFTPIAPVCRFYGRPAGGPNSHFFTSESSECDLVKRMGGWSYEGVDFYARPLGANRRCPEGHLAVNRAYNNGYPTKDSNHRFVTSDSEWRLMQAQGWALEGEVMCARP